MEPKCNLIIDTCCDLPASFVETEGVYVLKFPYIDGEHECLDDFYQSVSAKEFYDSMREGAQPHTAQLPVPAVQDAFRWAHEQGKPAVYLGFSSGLSGTFDSVCLLIEQMKEEIPDLDVTLVDTKKASIPQGLLTYEAFRQRKNGLTAAELAAWVEEARFFIDEYFMVEDLEALHRGGRIPASVAAAGSKLDVKPLLTIDTEGTLSLSGVARGRKKGLKALVEYWKKHRSEEAGGIIITGNADCPKDTERLTELIKKEDESAVVVEASVGPVIGSHVGPGMIAICFWSQDTRDGRSLSDKIADKVRSN